MYRMPERIIRHRPPGLNCAAGFVRGFGWLIAFAASADLVPCASADVTVAEVDAAIGQGVEALLDTIQVVDEIEYLSSAEAGKSVRLRGTVGRRTAKWVELRGEDGKIVQIQRDSIITWNHAGYVKSEMGSYHFGGPTALAGLALLSAGVGHNEPRLSALLETIATEPNLDSGTYVHSLRTAVLSAVLTRNLSPATREKYVRLVRKEVNWIVSAARGGGGYGYTNQDAPQWDHSNTQFANLGLWSGALADARPKRSVWSLAERHWLSTQTDSGGWTYRKNDGTPTPSMTVAGCNSLYIVLDRYYPLREGRYSLYEGIKPNRKTREQMQQVYDAILRGDAFLTVNPPDTSQNDGYELFGLERLGLASGRARIGGEDWYAKHVKDVLTHQWGSSVIGDAFALIFLAHGQAPVFVQKLEYSGDENLWNYYYRDLAGVTRYLSRTFERLYRWQIVPLHADLNDLLDAPILYISGSEKLELPDDTLATIRAYIDNGGFVFLHADRAKATFIDSATRVFEQMFKDRGYRFNELPADHPVYRCYFGGPLASWENRTPLSGLSDGSRTCVFLCPMDIAGAWHQEQTKFPDLFRIFANLRIYAAPAYQQLPRRLSESRQAVGAVTPMGKISVITCQHSGQWDRHPNAWNRYAQTSPGRCGVTIENRGVLKPNAQSQPSALPDIIHIKVPTSTVPTDKEVKTLTAAMNAGTVVLIDAADGMSDGIGSISRWVDALSVGKRQILSADHAIASGKFPGGGRLFDLQTTDAGASLRQANSPPPIYLRTLGDRVVLIACPFDLSAGMDRHFIWNRVGYEPDSTDRIIDNILLWTLEQKKIPLNPAP